MFFIGDIFLLVLKENYKIPLLKYLEVGQGHPED